MILSNPLKVENHLLVIPKRHVEMPWELTDVERVDIFSLINAIEPHLVKKYGGCDVRQNCRPFMEQSRYKVNHVHFHLIPRSRNDALYERVEKYETDIFRDASTSDMEHAAVFIKEIDS